MRFFALQSCLPAACLFGALGVAGCAVVDTGATVVKAGASVVGTTVSTAATVTSTAADVALKTASTTVTVASAGVSAASAAKTVTVAAASTAVAAGALLASTVTSMSAARRADDVITVSVVAVAADRFAAADGRSWATQNCAEVPAGQPALWVAMRTGNTEIRTSGGVVCPVLVQQ